MLKSLSLAVFCLLFLASGARAQSPYLLLAEVKEQYNQGHLDTALVICDRLLGMPIDEPLLEEAPFLKAYILADKGETEEAKKVLKEAVGKFPDSHHLPRAYFYLARIFKAEGDWSSALGYLRLIRKHYPESEVTPEAALLEADLLLEKRRYRMAEELLNWLIQRARERPAVVAQAAVKLLDLYHQLGREAEIGRLLGRLGPLDRLYSYAPDILYWQGYVAYREGRVAEAQRLWLRYVNLAPDSPRIRRVFYLLAEMARESRDVIKARQFYAYVASTWPASKEAVLAKFRLFQLKKNFYAFFGGPTPQDIGVILPVLSMICEKWPDDPVVHEVWPLRIELVLKQKGPRVALELSWEFLSRYPESPGLKEALFWINRSLVAYDRLFLSQKNYLGLLNYHWEHLDLISKVRSPEHWYLVGEAYKGLDLYPQARRAYARAWELKPDPALTPDVMASWAEVLTFSGELEAAAALIEDLLDKNPRYRSSPAILALRGRLALRERRFGLARELLLEAMSKSADLESKLRLWPLLVEATIGAADFKALERLFSQVPKDFPQKRLLLLLKAAGQQALSSGEVPFALDIYEKALKLQPDDPELLWYQALCFERLGQEAAAEEVWQKLSSLETQPYKELAQAMLKARELVDRARWEVL